MPGIYPEAEGQAKTIEGHKPPNPARGSEQAEGEGPQPEKRDKVPQLSVLGGVWMERWREMENARHRLQRCCSVGQWGKEKKIVPESLTPIQAVGSGRGVKMGATA